MIAMIFVLGFVLGAGFATARCAWLHDRECTRCFWRRGGQTKATAIPHPGPLPRGEGIRPRKGCGYRRYRRRVGGGRMTREYLSMVGVQRPPTMKYCPLTRGLCEHSAVDPNPKGEEA